MMRLEYLPANAAWAFLFGDAIITMGDYSRFFNTRRDAVFAADSCGLSVDDAGRVSVADDLGDPDEHDGE